MRRSLLKRPTTGIYHITCRGNNRNNIFETREAKHRYIYLLKEARERYDFELFSWVVMTNHVHLLIRIHETPLSRIMHRIQMSFSHWYNAKYDHIGHVFQGPYHFLECSNLHYFKNIIRYIHQNPARANIPEGIMYKWSSHRDYLNKGYWYLTDTEVVLSEFHGDKGGVLARYQAFMKVQEDVVPNAELEMLYVVEGIHPDPELTKHKTSALSS